MAEAKGSWMKMKSADVETLVVTLAKKGISAEKIGLILRDEHGIPKARLITHKKISQILKENKIESDPLKQSVTKRSENLGKHIEVHKHDYTAKQKLTKRLAQLRKINRS